MIEAWPEALALLKAPVRAGIQDAQPIALENGIIVFGVPEASLRRDQRAVPQGSRRDQGRVRAAPRRGAAFHVARPRLRQGRRVPADDERTRPQPAPVAEPEDDEAVDLDELADAPEAPPPDSVSRLADALGAEVVDERRR